MKTTKSKKTKKPTTMWAVRWLDYDGVKNPHPKKSGAWMLCCTKTLAENKRLTERQVITRVRVAIL